MEATSLNILPALSAWAQGMLAPILALTISLVYFWSSPSTETMSRRLLSSAHGASVAVLYMAAMAVFWAHKASPKFGTPFLFLLLIPVILVFASFFLYRGPKSVHLLQVLNLACLAWTFFIGSMAVTGNWL
jgi:hypothetical protein